MQVADELTENWDSESRTLHSDGTSKKGRSFITYDIVKNDGSSLVTGFRETASGDAASQLTVLEDILKDVNEMFKEYDKESSSSAQKIIKSIKNVMSDHCAVQKKFNDLLTCFRKDVLPTVVLEWEKMSEMEQSKMATINGSFCGLHYLVG